MTTEPSGAPATPEAAAPTSAPERPAGDRPASDRPGGDRPGGGDRGPRRDGPGGGKKFRYQSRRKVCQFCVDKVQAIDWRDTGRLKRYISDRGKMEARRKTGTCARHQRMLTEAIKRARHMALMPYTASHIRVSGGVGARG